MLRGSRGVSIGIVDDTSVEAARRQVELLRRLGPRQRLELSVKLTIATREMAMAGLRHAAGSRALSELELRRGLAERLYGAAVAERCFGTGR